MSKLKTVFMGTPEFAVPSLQALFEISEVLAVFVQPDKPAGRGLEMLAPPVKKKAIALGLKVLQPQKLAGSDEEKQLFALKPDLIVVAAYGQILKQNVLDLAPLGCINVHSSLLPRWRGAAPIQWAILSGDKESGVTLMKMVLKLDAGDILLQERTPITPDDTASTLHDRLAQIGADLIRRAVPQIKSIKPIAQHEADVTYATKLTKDMESIDFSKSAQEIDRRIRALTPWPGSSVKLESGEKIKILRAKLRGDLESKKATLFEKNGMLLLGLAKGALELMLLQHEGKKAVSAAEFLNGLKGKNISLPLKLWEEPVK